MKRTALWYTGLAVFILSIIFFACPYILGWDRNDIWFAGFPLSQIALVLLPICSLIGLELMYLGDRQAIKKRLVGKKGKGGDGTC